MGFDHPRTGPFGAGQARRIFPQRATSGTSRFSIFVAAMALLAVTAGCSSPTRSAVRDPSGSRTSDPTTSSATSTKSDALRLVTRYEAFVAKGDFSSAMALRCKRLRISGDDQVALWRSQSKLLLSASGAPMVKAVRLVPSSGLRPTGRVTDPNELLVTMGYPRGQSGTLRLLMIRESGSWRLCGEASAA